jgi:hypothetical protein
MMDTPHTTPQHEQVAIAHEQLLGAQLRATRVWTAVHNMQLVQTNVYPEASMVQDASPIIAEVMQPAPVSTVVEPATAEIISFPINKLEAERLAVQAALQQAA